LGQVIDLQAGDVIHAINGSPVASLDFLRDKVKSLARGSAVALQVERDGEMQYISFEIE
jgi:S1-C subfamily serine protease